MKVAVLGAGAWGTALALQLSSRGHAITLWGHDAGHLRDLAAEGTNRRYLPGIPLPPTWRIEPSLPAAVDAGPDAVVVAVPSKAFRLVARSLSATRGMVVSVTKGIEHDTGLTMCGILQEVAGSARVAALSGPSLALEVARGIPTAVVAASPESEVAQGVQSLFNGPSFRVYTSEDRLGVELGGALKNVVAIAAGVCDGLGFGDNSKAALVTRGIVEMRRLGVAAGARAETFAGLSGLGDLTVTCFSRQSRNRGFGERIGRGDTVSGIEATTSSVAEGYPTARSARQLARRHRVATPIIDEVYSLLYEGKSAAEALRALMTREAKGEQG
ncbi:MAG TPA: glycerol-3-phosphate dehydrogenase [Verrucomicrobiales bacterium]|nr:glycerol-3-phosphate dehydrogenase [Verrucomicrobiales bacterium]